MPLFKDIDIALAEYMYEEFIVKGVQHTYKDAAAVLSNRLGRHIDPHMGLPHPLGRLSVFCFTELGLPLISVGIYSAESKAPGEGFFKIACDYRPEYINMTPLEAQKIEKKLVRECKDWQRLRDYLDGVPVATVMSNQNETITDLESLSTKTETVHFALADPVYPDEIGVSTPILSEGAVKTVYVNVRERNPDARRLCISSHGAVCAVCEVDLGDLYGAEFSGKIHVHHLNPMSAFDDEHAIDPVNDLCPVCPNCHMIIHCRQGDPYSIDEVKAFMAAASQTHN